MTIIGLNRCEYCQGASVIKPESALKITVFGIDDEIPPIPLEEYAPMEIGEESGSDEVSSIEDVKPSEKAPQVETTSPGSELPSLEELSPPDFEIETSASEYDTEFVLEEESEALGSVLKDLGWTEDEE